MASYSIYLAHHGTKGMHWHDRHYQNYDGSLTPEGRIRYGIKSIREKKITKLADKSNKLYKQSESLKSKRKNVQSKAHAENAAYMRKVDKYRSSQRAADRALFFKDAKQRKADRNYEKMSKEVIRKSRSDRAYAAIESKVTKLEYRQLRIDKKLKSKIQKYIKTYGKHAYNEFLNRDD